MPGDAPVPGRDGSAAEGLYLVAMAVAMAFSGAFFLPPLLLLAPAPLAALVYRRGYRAGMVAGLLLAFAIFWLQGSAFSGDPGLIPADVLRQFQVAMLAVLLLVGLVGLTIGGGWREGETAQTVVLLGAAAFIVPPLLAYGIAAVAWGVDLVEGAYGAWDRVQAEIARQKEIGDLPPQLLDQMDEWVDAAKQSSQAVRPVLPAVLATAGFAGSLGSVSVARWMLRRRTPRPEPLPPFQLWRLPWYLVFGFLFGQGAMLLASLGTPLGVLDTIGRNLHLFFSNVFLVQGLAVVYFYLTRRPLPAVVRAVILVAGIFWLSLLVVWLGALDVWFNFRRLPLIAREGDGN